MSHRTAEVERQLWGQNPTDLPPVAERPEIGADPPLLLAIDECEGLPISVIARASRTVSDGERAR
jgi:hypothetical protein